jgi:hypothetical protein
LHFWHFSSTDLHTSYNEISNLSRAKDLPKDMSFPITAEGYAVLAKNPINAGPGHLSKELQT